MSRRKYMAVLFAPDGEYVIDYRQSDTIEEVQDKLADQGSKWIFYPFQAVASDYGHSFTTSRARIVDTAWPLNETMGKTIRGISNYIRDNQELFDNCY